MSDPFAMRCRQTVRNLQRVLRRFTHRKRRGDRAAQHVAQRLAFEQFTDEIGRAFMNPSVEHSQHIRMIQRRQRLRLLLEAPQPIRVRREVLGQHLHRDVAIEPRVPRAKHFTHPTRADAGGDSILVERGADHWVRVDIQSVQKNGRRSSGEM